MEKVRINKYIASSGVASRRAADELIKEGKVRVNGKVITEPGMMVCARDKILVNGKKIESEHKKYFLFHKPAGYITTKNDPEGRKTIYDILPESFKTLNTAGRLDRLSSGLIIMTNDGELIQQLTHPKISVAKVYKVLVNGRINEEHLKTLAKGIEIEPGQIAYAEAIVTDYEKGITTLKITLHQGFNRQIRKMMDKIERPVVALKRTSHATFNITGLEKGKFKKILPKEISNLKRHLEKKVKNANKI